eukprot:scaffold17.g517.t1
MPLPVRPLRDFVTFIVPSLGRPTLNRTLESLINQTMPHSWRAIVLFDGLPLQHVDAPLLSDPRVRTVYLDRRMGAGNGGGGVRNLAARLARTPWVALCDDDDTLHPRYAERLLYETQHFPTAECVDFKMFLNDYIEPGDTQGIYIGMGISFAMRRSTMLEGFNFVPSYKEDGEFLLMYQESRRPILISPFICYCVRAPCSRPAKHDARADRLAPPAPAPCVMASALPRLAAAAAGGSLSSTLLRQAAAALPAALNAIKGARLSDLFHKDVCDDILASAIRPQHPVSLRYMLQFGSNSTPHQLIQAAQFLQASEELPVRLAHRVADLEALPAGLADRPQVLKARRVRDWYVESFRDIRAFPPVTSPASEARFTRLLAAIYQRHRNVVPVMATGVMGACAPSRPQPCPSKDLYLPLPC